MVASPQPQDTESRLRRTEQALANLTRKVPNSLLVQTGAGQVLVDIGPSGFVDANGNQLNSVTIRDPISGFPILQQSPATITDNPDGTQQGDDWFWRMDDRAGNRVVATDGLSGVGLALPYVNVELVPYWTGNQSATPGTSGYRTVTASIVAAAPVLCYEGRLGYVSHPALSIDGIWGRATGTGAEVITYTLVVAGTTVGSWNETALIEERHTFDVSDFVAQKDLPVQLLMKSSISNTDTLACHPLGCFLRQTPDGGIFG